jgi:hypothetical protein
MTPYTDIEVTDKYIIREFNENIDPIEMLWHRDNEHRTIEILGETELIKLIEAETELLTEALIELLTELLKDIDEETLELTD